MVDVAVIGAAGYAGIETVRLVLGHPQMRLTLATSAADEGKRISDVYPALLGATDMAFEAPDTGRIEQQAQMAFLSVPHTAALDLVPQLLDAGVRVVDLSADFRLKEAAVYEEWYDTHHTHPELLAGAVYGLPELDRSGLPGAALVACPGCYPTASILACAPALAAGLVDGDRVVIDAKSGVSGAGRGVGPATHFSAVNESLHPYKVAAHRHTPEIEQGLTTAAGRAMRVTFAPHLVPMTRGLLATAYLPLSGPLTTAEAIALYRARYAVEPFVHVHDAGVMPATREVCGTNRAHIGLTVDARTRTLVVACAIDNLVKGSAGQAIQCANAVLGHAETDGLTCPQPVV